MGTAPCGSPPVTGFRSSIIPLISPGRLGCSLATAPRKSGSAGLAVEIPRLQRRSALSGLRPHGRALLGSRRGATVVPDHEGIALRSRLSHPLVAALVAWTIPHLPFASSASGNPLSNQTPFGEGPVPGAGLCDGPGLSDRRPITLPADDGPHSSVYFEWWWWNGHLVTPDGRRYGFIVYFASKPLQHYHFLDYTLTDVSGRRFHYARQAFIPGAPKPVKRGVWLRGDHAWARGANGRDKLHLAVDGYRLDLSLTARKPPVLHFGSGHATFYCNTASFYSRTRMKVEGTLRASGARPATARLPRPVRAHLIPESEISVAVTGIGYFEHAWGNLPGIDVANWNEFTLHLDDGRDLYLGLMRAPPNGKQFTFEFGAISDSDGKLTTLHRGEFRVVPTGVWKRDESCTYPVAYKIDAKDIHIRVRPSLNDQELRARRWPQLFAFSNTPVYWDGEVLLTGSSTGRGYLDMARYCLT
jgi:predicted secreted hydrolase